jgi:hypothetical protein
VFVVPSPVVHRSLDTAARLRGAMSRSGVVAAPNPHRSMVGIKADDGGFTIIELLTDWELDVGDEVVWANDYGLGSEISDNRTKGTRCEVYVQNHDVSASHLQHQLFF